MWHNDEYYGYNVLIFSLKGAMFQVDLLYYTLIQQIINGLSLGSVYALIAVGYSLVYSILSFSNFAHGGFLVVGAYIAYGLIVGFEVTIFSHHLFSVPAIRNIWIAGVFALFGAGIVAILTERLAYKPIRERTSVTLYLLIASMGVSIVIENIFVILVGGRFRRMPHDLLDISVYEVVGGVTVSSFDIVSFGMTAVLLISLQLFLTKTRWGLAIRAAACDMNTAGLMGVNTARLIAIVFFVAGLLAAVSGVFIGARYIFFPQMGGITIKAFIAAVIGGLGSLPGAVVGGLFLGLAEMLTVGFISSEMRDLVVFSLLIVVLLIKPSGLFGKQISDKI